MNTTAVVQLKHVQKDYRRVQALQDVCLSVPQGECVGLIGHNGAGKTTLLKLILGLATVSGGEVRVWDTDPSGPAFRKYRQQLGYLPENVAFDGGVSGRQTLRFFARLKGVSNNDVDVALVELGLRAAANRAVRTYSKGMRQRLGLAQALLGKPQLLIFDEPTSGLDPALREEFYSLVDALTSNGATVILSSHSLAELEHHVDRIAIMRQGQLVAADTIAGLRQQIGAPIELRVAVSPGTASMVAARLEHAGTILQVNHASLTIGCTENNKIGLLRDITNKALPVTDVAVEPPRLEEIYRHFSTAGPGR